MRNFWNIFKKSLVLSWHVDHSFFIITMLITFTTGLIPIAISYVLRIFIDDVTRIAQSGVHILTLGIVGVLASRYLLEMFSDFQNTYMYQYIQRMSRYKMQNYLNYAISEKISSLDVHYFEDSKTQDLIRKVTTESISRIPGYTASTFMCVAYATTLVGVILALIPFGWWIPVCTILVALPKIRSYQARMNLEWGLFNRQTLDSRRLSYLSGLAQSEWPVIENRIFGSRAQILEKISRLQEIVFQGLAKALKKYIRMIWLPIFFEALFVFIVIYIKLPLALSGTLTIGSLVFFVQMLDQTLRSTSDINYELVSFFDDARYIQNYFDLQDLPPKIIDKEPGHEFEEIISPKIQFQNISFGYPNGPLILKNISFTINPGEHLAIVGPNGAGKTTLIKVLLRLYDPTKGSIIVNDFDLKDIKRDNWYQFISTLFQSFQKYSLTVRENITLSARGEENKEKVRKAAQMSGADEFIEKFPKKYDQQLGREFDGEELSVGQWQKLALARAFYEEAPVLILDEPTSAIDAEAEAEIFDNLNKVYKDKTVIFISHRFSTVRNADKIIVLKDGRIAEEGTHESLIGKKGIYARMFKKQAKGYID